MSLAGAGLAGLALAVGAPGAGGAQGVPDLILYGGDLYTVDESRPWAEALAVRDGVIVALGDDEEILALADGTTERIDLAGRMAMPGIHDPHVHLLEGGVNLDLCYLPPRRSLATYERLLRDCARGSQAGTPWVRAAGPFVDDLIGGAELPIDVLDRAVPDRPALVLGGLGHSLWVNTAALAAAGIDAATEDPRGGVIHRDPATGRVSGVLLDAAQHAVLDVAEAPTDANLASAYVGLLRGMQLANRRGITSVSDAGGYWTRGHEAVWARAESEGRMTVRASNALYLFPQRGAKSQIAALRARYRGDPDSLLRFDQAKVYVDGILDTEGAALLEPYASGEAEGLRYFTRRRLDRYLRELEPLGFQFNFHVIGDRGARMALDAIERQRARTATSLGHRLTHLYLVHVDDRPRFADLGVVADLQLPASALARGYVDLLREQIGAERAAALLPAASLAAAGATMVLSSDWDADPMTPFRTLARALSRDIEALPDLSAAIRMLTINGARVLRQGDRVGSLEVGKLADVIVLDRNLFEVTAESIAETAVLLTLLAGDEVYRSSGS